MSLLWRRNQYASIGNDWELNRKVEKDKHEGKFWDCQLKVSKYFSVNSVSNSAMK